MAIEPAEIPPHMLENPTSNAQKKAFAQVKESDEHKEQVANAEKVAKQRAADEKAAAKEPAKKRTAKKAAKKSASTADSGYGVGAGKEDKP